MTSLILLLPVGKEEVMPEWGANSQDTPVWGNKTPPKSLNK